MRTALALALAAWAAATSPVPAQTARLPRDVFDVIPPESRIEGERGRMRVVQSGCRVGPTSWARRRIVDVAVQEWAVFGFQVVDARAIETGRLPDGVVSEAANPPRSRAVQARHMLRIGRRETDPRLARTIAGYWSATPDGAQVIGRQNRRWQATDADVGWVEPWSAAFVSWVMCEAGLGEPEQFQRDVAHRVYIDQAIRARDGQATAAAYVAYDAGEAEISPGDLMCNARGTAGYRTLADRRRDLGEYAGTHCDIVVRVDHDRINVIGGNVIDGVTLTILPLTSEGTAFARPVSDEEVTGARTIFAHLKLTADPVEDDAMDRSPTLRAMAAP